jgi:signal transduction histidine kinase/ActR/RegA family two-component response regulator/HPt (histidine-containing phosphotransfer) domain-containing protein
MPPMRVFSAHETGVATMAWSAAQDPSGILYFGCDTVVSFDGDRWRQEKMDPTYLVRGLDVGPNGRIWLAGENQIGWFEPAPEGRLAYHSLMPRLPPGQSELGDVWRVYAQGDESAVFVGRERVLRWDGHAMQSWDYPGMHLLWSTRTARSIYVHYPPLGLLKIGVDGPSVEVKASVIGSADVRWLDDEGRDWLLLTSEGFKSLHDGVCTPLESEASNFARANTPTSVVGLDDGSLAIGTLQGGIAVVRRSGEILRVFDTRSGMPENQVYSLFVDREGALWSMGPSHIIRLALRSGTSVYGRPAGYPPGGCDALAESSGSIYVASHSDIYRLDSDPKSGGAGQFTALGATSSRFYSLLSVPSGLAVGQVRGLGFFSGGQMTLARNIPDGVFRTYPSLTHADRILASTIDRIFAVDPVSGDTDVVAAALPDYADTVVDEPSGRTWIGTPSRGLFYVEKGITRPLPAAPRFGLLPSGGPALVARAGTTVVALTEGGAFFLDAKNGRFAAIAGFPTGHPRAVSNPDGHGAVWAALDPDTGGHSPRLGKITAVNGAAAWSPQSVEGLSGIGSLLGLRVARLSGRESLWITGTESLICAGPDALKRRPPPRSPLVRAWVISDDRNSAALGSEPLPFSTRGLHIEYSSLDFGMRPSERFQTMLAGAENLWSTPTDSADRDISGLREGSYDFYVRIVTDSGEAGKASTLHFEIAPPWWRTPIARAASLVGGALVVLALVRLWTRSLKRRALLLERMVRQRTEELQKANAAKTEFVASMSHEIRNPMGGILASSIELSESPLAPDQEKLVTTIRSCATFLATLVEDVLDFAAIEAGAYKVALAPFSPREILDNVVTMLEPRAADIQMTAAVDLSLPEKIVGDAARIQQVIVNFAANSIKFGGRTVSLSARQDGAQVVFAVSDDGVGIPADEQENLFIRFSRLKSARNSAIPGSGLGLAVSRVLAERMGGSVGFTPQPGRGSTFFLRIPLQAGAGALNVPEFNGRGARALVVEDIGYNARALGLMLGRIGFEVDFAVDGEEALGRLRSTAYDAVFLDCDIPRVSGIEVAMRHRASETGPGRTLLIATTALSTKADQDACMAAGMDSFLTKPITPDKLRSVLAACCSSQSRLPAAERFQTGETGIKGLKLDLLVHLSDGSPESLGKELSAFTASLHEAIQGVASARATGSRPAVSSAAHRVLSLARMVGAEQVASTAADLQDYASAYSDSELEVEIAILGRRAGELRGALARLAETGPVNPSWAS